MHKIVVRRGDVTLVRERIERRLDVETACTPIPGRHGGGWDVTFQAAKDVDLDFLRPDVLPPLPRDVGYGCVCGSGNKRSVHSVGCTFQPILTL